jgi:hypothetical protein
MNRMSLRAWVFLSASSLGVLVGCDQTASLGSPGPSATGGTNGSGGAPSTGGTYYIGNTAPGGQSGSGGSSGTGGSSTSDAGGNLADLCSTTGGTISTQSCCSSAANFPNSCEVGACGCSPTNSKTISMCLCKSGTCFDPAVGCRPYSDAGN